MSTLLDNEFLNATPEYAEKMTNNNQCHTCDGQGVYLTACDADDCAAQCTGHETICEHCNGKGVRQ